MSEAPRVPPAFVLDGSIALAWYFEDEQNDYADAVARSLASATAIVPAIWSLEVCNAILVAERRARCTHADLLRWTQLLGLLPVAVDEFTFGAAFQDTMTLAHDQRLSAYDGSYLELAVRRGIPLATLDARLQHAAEAVGVAAYDPAG